MPQVGLVALIVSLTVLVACNAKIPAMSPNADAYNAAITYAVAPALSSAVALGLIGSRMHTWENLAARMLYLRRFAMGALAMALGVAILLPSAPHAVVEQPVLLAVQGVLACAGLGMLVSPFVAYPGQASIAFLYGLVSLNTAWAFDGSPISALLAIGAPPRPATFVFAAVMAVSGLMVQAIRSPRLLD